MIHLFFMTMLMTNLHADNTYTKVFEVTGVVQSVDSETVTLKDGDNLTRLSRKYFRKNAPLIAGRIVTAYYPMTFKRKPSAE